MSVRDKVFVKKSRKGNVVLAAREHYLRDDLACGALACAECPVCVLQLSCRWECDHAMRLHRVRGAQELGDHHARGRPLPEPTLVPYVLWDFI